MQSLIRSKSAGVTGGRGTAGAGPGRDLLYHLPFNGGTLRPAIFVTSNRDAHDVHNTRTSTA